MHSQSRRSEQELDAGVGPAAPVRSRESDEVQPRGNAEAVDALGAQSSADEVIGQSNEYGEWWIYPDAYQGELPASSRQTFHIRQSDYDQVLQELDAFHLQCFGSDNFQPSTGPGIFDVFFEPAAGRAGTLRIVLRIHFEFVSALSPEDYPDASEESLQWGDEGEKETFAEDCLAAINEAWSGALRFRCERPFWENVLADVEVCTEQSEQDPHYTVTVQKIPPGEFAGSAVWAAAPGATSGRARLDSEDLRLTRKSGGSQRGAVHEFGHMIGLGDEYSGKDTPRHSASYVAAGGQEIATGADDRVMSGGERILESHYITFLEGLRHATGMEEWGYDR